MTEIPARLSVVTLGARDSSPAPLADRQLAAAVLGQGLQNVLALLGRAPKLTNRADITAEPPIRTEDDEAARAWWTGKPGGRVPVAVDNGAIAGWSAFMHRFLS